MRKLLRFLGFGRVKKVGNAEALRKALRKCRKGTRIHILNNIIGNFTISNNDVSIYASSRKIMIANDSLNEATRSPTFVVQGNGVQMSNFTIHGSVDVKGNNIKMKDVTIANTDCALYIHSDDNEFTDIIFENISDSCAQVYGQSSRFNGCKRPADRIGFKLYGENNMLNGQLVPPESVVHNEAYPGQPIPCSFQSTENLLQNLKYQLDVAELEIAAPTSYWSQPTICPETINLVEVMKSMVILEVGVTTRSLGAPARQVEEEGMSLHKNTSVQETYYSSYYERAIVVRPKIIAIQEMQDDPSPSTVEPSKITKGDLEEMPPGVEDRPIRTTEAAKLAEILCNDPMLCNNMYQLINHLPIPVSDQIELHRHLKVESRMFGYLPLINECLVAAGKRSGKIFTFKYFEALLLDIQLVSSAEDVIALLGQLQKPNTGDPLPDIVMSSSPEKPSHVAINMDEKVPAQLLIPSLSQVFEKARDVGNALLEFAKILLKGISCVPELFLETVKVWTPEKINAAVTAILAAWGWEMVDNLALEVLGCAVDSTAGRDGADVVRRVYEQHAAPIGEEMRMRPMYSEVCFHCSRPL